jgi:hypothetical protein
MILLISEQLGLQACATSSQHSKNILDQNKTKSQKQTKKNILA